MSGKNFPICTMPFFTQGLTTAKSLLLQNVTEPYIAMKRISHDVIQKGEKVTKTVI